MTISINRVIDELNGIREVTLMKKARRGKQPEPKVVLSKMNELQQQMFDFFKLSRYLKN